MNPIDLTPASLAITSGLILVCALLSLLLALRVHRALLIAALRMVVQLMLVGFVLRLLFERSNPWLTLLAALVMACAASYEVGARQDYRLPGPWQYLTTGSAIGISSMIIAVLALTTALCPTPWKSEAKRS